MTQGIRCSSCYTESISDTSMKHAAFDVQNLLVRIRSTTILRDLHFTIPQGSVVGLLGPSGSGKTTLMRSLVGLQAISGGSLELLGIPAGDAELRPRIGYVTQSPAVYSDLTVRENLAYFAAINQAERTAVDDILAQVELTDMAEHIVETLSGGQRARVSLAIALVHNPDILILDEPTVGLDPLLRQKLWDYFHRLADSGRTLLISSHVMDEAERCDSILLLREGELLAAGTTDGLRQQTGAQHMDDVFIRLIEDRS